MQQFNQQGSGLPPQTQMPGFPPSPFIFPPMPLLPLQTIPPQPPPNPPEDPEQKNIIDKLANFVARNGPEFESVTKTKQKDNPKFQFLFGGEYHVYYQFKLNIERELIRFQQIQPPQTNVPPPPQVQFLLPPPSLPPNQNDQINLLQSKIQSLKEQISQSEKNLSAQDEFLKSKKKMQLEEILNSKVNEKLNKLANESLIDLNELEHLVTKIAQVCSKDSIANGRNFVFNKDLNEKKLETIGYYLIQRIMSKEANNDARLHLIYYINDLVDNGIKKGIDLVKHSMEKIIIPCFCHAIENTDDEKRSKLSKLLDKWKKYNYFSHSIIEKLRDPSTSIKYHHDSLIDESRLEIEQMDKELSNQFKQFEQQHNEYVNHSSLQIVTLQNQINQLIQQQQQTPSFLPLPPPIMPTQQQFNQNTSNNHHQQQQQQQQQQNTNFNNNNQPTKQQPQPLMSLMSIPFDNNPSKSNQSNQKPINQFNQPPPSFNVPPPSPVLSQQQSGPTPLMSIKSTIPMPPTGPPTNLIIPPPILVNPSSSDLSKPPPGFGPALPPTQSSNDLINKPPQSLILPEIEMPYYNLPAGLMQTLIKIEDCDYKALDPKLVKLPPPQPPTERLLKAVEDFYAPINQAKPRNIDGWEKNGLYEFYKSKIRILMQREVDKFEKKQNKSKKKDRSRSRSRSRTRSRSRSRSRSRRRRRRSYSSSSQSRSRTRSRSRSRSRNRKSSSRSRSRSRSRSSSRSRTKSRAYSRSRSRSRTPPRQVQPRPIRRRSRSRSATPPNLMFTSAPATADKRLDNSNKGHQLMLKMGWSGSTGLGRTEQGIYNPIEGGEVREKTEMYRGVGVKSDPFEAFRKNKSQGYIQRLRDRDEQREMARKAFGKDDK